VWLWGTYLLTLALGFGGMAVALTVKFFPSGAVGLLMFGPLAYLLARMAWRVRAAKVVISPDGVLIVGLWRTSRVPLDDATEFKATIAPGNTGQPTIELINRSRRPIRIWIFNRNGFVWQLKSLAQSLEPDADDLNRALAAAKQGS